MTANFIAVSLAARPNLTLLGPALINLLSVEPGDLVTHSLVLHGIPDGGLKLL